MVFADRFLHANDIVTLYFCKKVNLQSTYEPCRLKVTGIFIDVKPNLCCVRPLYVGAHFSNFPFFANDEYENFGLKLFLGATRNTTLETG